MKTHFIAMFASMVIAVTVIASSAPAQPKEINSRSQLAGSGSGKKDFETEILPSGGRVISIEVNVGRYPMAGEIVKGLRFVSEDAEGKESEHSVGPCDGKWQKAIEQAKDVRLVGVSGRYGLLMDSIRFHFSDGTTSPKFGGTGGESEFSLILKADGGKFKGAIRGLFGKNNNEGLTDIGLLLVGNGVAAELAKPDTLSLTIRGEVDAEFAPIVGNLTALYYECYPELLKRFDNPKKPASRNITLVLKRGMKVPAYCAGSEISVSIDWLKKNPNDIALFTHELTHAVQGYPVSEGWLTEGIADYARQLYGPKKQQGWSLPESFNDKQSYKDGYRTTARFLLWLDKQHPGSVDKIHRQLQDREFKLENLKEIAGKPIETLWEECLGELKKK